MNQKIRISFETDSYTLQKGKWYRLFLADIGPNHTEGDDYLVERWSRVSWLEGIVGSWKGEYLKPKGKFNKLIWTK